YSPPLLSLQLSSGNPIYDKYYRQVDPTGSGRVAAADAALFLKRSGLADLVLGKIWDLADSERKGALNKQQFFIALRLVACAQNGLEVALRSLNVALPPPQFNETSSPQLAGVASVDTLWVVKPEEKIKFDSIFESLGPVGGILTGDKVKPVLLNSKLPVDVLGRVWELSDIDRDGMLDRDEFSVAMYLVYRALEGEHVPMSLPPPLVPPSKRKKPSLPPAMPLLPSPPSVKDSRSSHAGSRSLPHPPKPFFFLLLLQWVVSAADKTKYDELFGKTDGDMDGLVSGPEVRDIFLKTGLPSATLARIWELCDIGDIGKLTREQFALALHLINQRLTKGLEPPQSLLPEMIPPSDRQTAALRCTVELCFQDTMVVQREEVQGKGKEGSVESWMGLGGFGVPGLPALSLVAKYSCLLCWTPREKSSVEEEIKEKEEAIRQRSTEVQDLQGEVAKESGELQQLQAQRQKVQDALEELDQQKGSLEEQLTFIRQQTNQETHLISSLQSEHEDQEQKISQFEEELVQAREELLALQEESRKLQEKVQAAQEQLTPLQESVRDSFTQVAQVSLGESTNPPSLRKIGPLFHSSLSPYYSLDFCFGENRITFFVKKPQCCQKLFLFSFFIDYPFKDDPFGKADVADPFGGDPFKGSDPFAADSFFQAPGAPFAPDDPFTASSADPFGPTAGPGDADPFGSQDGGADPFSCSLPSSDLAVVSRTQPAPRKGHLLPTVALSSANSTRVNICVRPSGKRASVSRTESSESFQRRGPFLQQPSGDFSSSLPAKDPLADPFAPSSPPRHTAREADRFASFDKYPTEDDMIEWAKRESEREEKERLARLTQQEQEDLELAIALSQSELS
uniref:Epidermal growth factor receptor pathway substrate 15 n=1 Tax=Gasterosteus aculeatus aculeatus TaxID=481459 RepID=A0AAQ4R653_GASAC